MKVLLPQDLRTYLSQTTGYDVLLQKQVKEKNFNLLRIANWEQKQFLQLRRDNQQTLFKFTHDRDVEEIQQTETDIKSQTAQLMKKIEAEKV